MKIRMKIFMFLLLFCSFLIALLWLFQVIFLDSIYKQIKIAEVSAAMNTLTASVNSGGFSSVADSIYQSRGVNISILSANGTIIYATDSFLRPKDMTRELARLYSLTRENGGEYFEYPSDGSAGRPGGNPFGASRALQEIYACKLIGDKLIVLSAMISPVDATVGALKMELYFITAIMVLFSIGLAFLIARHVSKPIVSLNRSAKRLATGRYDTAFDAKGYLEIRELAETLNAAAKELSTVDSLRRELVANISHDLRTPLTLIAGYAEAMRDLPGESTPENAQIIVDESKRLNKLVGEVLDLSKLQAGALKICPAPFNLTESLRGAVERLSEFTKSSGYRILLEASGDVDVSADESSISQVIYNLLTNAINFTGEDKTVAVRQIVTPKDVTVEVADSGKGIAEEELPYIWDRYYRTGKKHKRAVIGTGIGLSIVKSIMDLHGGAYGARPEPGGGSVFWIRLKL